MRSDSIVPARGYCGAFHHSSDLLPPCIPAPLGDLSFSPKCTIIKLCSACTNHEVRFVLAFEDALEKILKHSHRLLPVRTPISHALGSVLAEEIKAREAIPLFDSSSVDGYAVRSDEIKGASDKNPVSLPLQGTVFAGATPPHPLRPSHTMKIMTGAPLPRHADAVVMREIVRDKDRSIVFKAATKRGNNLRRRGEEFSKGETVFLKGLLITPPVVGMCAALGYPSLKVYRKPRVAIVVNGNELRSPSAKLRPGQIRDSNSFAIAAALESIGIVPCLILHSRDTKEHLSRTFARALMESDVVVSAGGVSVGDSDFVKDVLSDLRVRTVFWKVAMKPGKPNYFGTRGKKIVFGLPGNPVSAMISLETLVMPALRKMMGIPYAGLSTEEALLETDFRKAPGRLEFVRAIATRTSDGRWSVRPAVGQGSHMIGGLARANCVIVVPVECEQIAKGEPVTIRFLSWNRK